MDSNSLARTAGFPVSANWSVLVILWLLTWSLASTLRRAVSGYSTEVYWFAGTCGAVVLLASLLAHELAHAIESACAAPRGRRLGAYVAHRSGPQK